MGTDHLVPDDQAGQRLDLFLVSQLPDLSRSAVQKLIEGGRVSSGGRFLKARHPVRAGERITVELPDRPAYPNPEEQPLTVLYEDESLLVLDKPAGMTVHPNEVEGTGTLVQAVLARWPQVAEAVYDPSSEISRLRPGIVHRLDKDTSGAIVVAKTAEALRELSRQFQEHQTQKEYLALLYGRLAEEQEVHTRMARKPGRRNLMGTRGLEEEGREAVTLFQPLRPFTLPGDRAATLAACRITTGRTHQIRVHGKHIGQPVLGDELYGHKSSLALSRALGIRRQMLHAAWLSFCHPASGRTIEVEAPLPADMQAAMAALDKLAAA